MKRRSLAFLVASGLVALTTLIVGAWSAFNYVREKERAAHDLDQLARLQIRETCVALAEPVWNIDRGQIATVIDAMALPQSVYGLQVRAAGQTFGLQRDARWQRRPWTGRGIPPGVRVYDGDIVYAGNTIGHARLYVSQHLVERELRALRMRMIGTVVLADIGLVLAVYLWMARLVLRPVRSIERYAAAVSTGGQPEPPAPAAVELTNLRHSIEAMVHQLDLRHVELLAETARRAESEQRFASIFEAVTDAIIIRDPVSGEVLDFNQHAARMFGYEREEMLALPLGGLSSGEEGFDARTAAELIRNARDRGGIYEWRVRHADGHAFSVEINMQLATIGGEEQVILVARDITQRKKMEETVRQNERMSAIGGLVAGVAHEVRNPLFGISATLEAFEAEFGKSDETAEYMTTLRRDVTRLTRLMNDLLEYGSARPLLRRMQPLQPIIDEALRVCAPAAREKEMHIEPDVDPSLPPLDVDADRMVQVLKNVIENAIDFSSAGSTVDVRARMSNNGARSVVITIVDRGPGFRETDLPHLFEPFFTRRRGGTGLGLAIVQKIVAEHGGEVAAQNAPAGGACVEIRLHVSDRGSLA